MKLLKRILALLFVLALLVSCGTTPSETDPETGTPGETSAETDPNGEQAPTKNPADTLVVGAPEFPGSYINGFGNATYDVWIKNLLHDYGTYTTDEGGAIVLNTTVVKGDPEVTTDEAGNKTFTFTLNENLVWNDGTPITAKDYVFSFLFTDSAEMASQGSSSILGDFLPGYTAYRKGEADSFPGVKYLDTYQFSVTLAAENLPYFYETSAASASPMPMHRYSPNLDIGADGSSLAVKEGYTLTDADIKDFTDALEAKIANLQEAKDAYQKDLDDYVADNPGYEETEDYQDDLAALAKYDADIAVINDQIANAALPGAEGAVRFLLQSNAVEVSSVYRLAPDVTSGAYNFVSNENQTVTVTLNDKYVGDFRGDKPTIKNVVIKTVNQNTDVDQIITGDLDLVTGVIQGEKIEKILGAPDKAGATSYSRNGYGMISMKNHSGATQYKEVRQAVAYLLDRPQFVQNVLGGYGTIVDGEYGLSQWMYQAREEEFKEQAISYTLDFDKANAALDASPYKFESDGVTPWDSAKAIAAYEADKEGFNYWRYDADGTLLEINHFGTTENEVTDTINTQLPDNGKRAGLKYTVTAGDFNTLLDYLYNPKNTPPEEMEFTAFNLATGFTAIYDPYYSYHSSFASNQRQNSTATSDPVVDELVVRMRSLESTQTEEYADVWLEWALWYNENLPQIPLYSNQYYDMYHIRVKGLDTTPVWDWSRDISDLSLAY